MNAGGTCRILLSIVLSTVGFNGEAMGDASEIENRAI